MDLRIVKTKKVIREAFLKLRQTQRLEKIKVTDICSTALINKTTFYKYHQDIFALSEEMEREAFALFWDCFDAKDCLFTNPERFIIELPKTLDGHGGLLHLLFRDRLETFFKILENGLKDYYSNEEQSAEENIRMTFVIGGMLHTIKELKHEGKYADDFLVATVASIVNSLISNE